MNKADAKWHHEITHFPDLILKGYISNYKKITNFCTYFWLFLFKLLVLIPFVVILIGLYLGFFVGGMIDWVGTEWVSWEFYIEHHLIFTGTLIMVLALSVMAMLIIGRDKLDDHIIEARNRPDYKEKPPGFFLMCYRKFKGKYCPKMDY